jgi:hypothetical protein
MAEEVLKGLMEIYKAAVDDVDNVVDVAMEREIAENCARGHSLTWTTR